MKKISFLSILLFAISLCACISCGYLLSTVALVSSIFESSQTITVEEQKFFAISTSKSILQEEVKSQQQDIQAIDSAGFVYESEGYFYLIASIYQNINDAELVKANLAAKNITAEILTITLPSQSFSGNFAENEKSIITQAMQERMNVFKSLYDISISLDTQVITQAKASTDCNAIYGKHITVKTNFSNLLKNENSQDLLSINENLESIYQSLSKIIEEEYQTQNQTFSSLIKYVYCEIVLSNI